MQVNRSSYYQWIKHKDIPKQWELDRVTLTHLIKDVHKRYPSYGYHRIAAIIREETGWVVTDHRVHKCCQAAEIHSQAKHYKSTINHTGQEHKKYPNYIGKCWAAVIKELELIVSDMTVIKYRKTNYETTFYLDIYARNIVGYAYSSSQGDVTPYYKGLEQVMKKLKGIEYPTILHTDQGSVYSSTAFENAHQDYNIIRSMSRAGTPTDNPIIESMNGWIKAEIKVDFDIDSWETYEEFLDYFVEYYNMKRPAYSLKYKTPNQYLLDSRL